jgi:hypothetical protein
MREPWERLKGESSKAYAAFCLYRDMGKERSIAKAAQKDGGGTARGRRYEKWSSRWRWLQRAQGYDDNLDRELRAKNEKQLIQAAERQARLGQLLQSKSIEKMMGTQGTTLTVSQAAMLAKIGAEMESKALGMPTHIIKAQVTEKREEADDSNKTDDELREEAIVALVNSGFSRENATVIVDQMEGANYDGQRTRDCASSESSDPPVEKGPREG